MTKQTYCFTQLCFLTLSMGRTQAQRTFHGPETSRSSQIFLPILMHVRIASLQHCEFRMRGHYHCLRTGCYFVTNITTKLPWHIKKHEKAERRAANGFKYFTKREECGRLGTEAKDGRGLPVGCNAALKPGGPDGLGHLSRYSLLLPPPQAHDL